MSIASTFSLYPQVEIIGPDEFVPEDYCPTRLRLFVDKDGVIIRPPRLA